MYFQVKGEQILKRRQKRDYQIRTMYIFHKNSINSCSGFGTAERKDTQVYLPP